MVKKTSRESTRESSGSKANVAEQGNLNMNKAKTTGDNKNPAVIEKKKGTETQKTIATATDAKQTTQLAELNWSKVVTSARTSTNTAPKVNLTVIPAHRMSSSQPMLHTRSAAIPSAIPFIPKKTEGGDAAWNKHKMSRQGAVKFSDVKDDEVEEEQGGHGLSSGSTEKLKKAKKIKDTDSISSTSNIGSSDEDDVSDFKGRRPTRRDSQYSVGSNSSSISSTSDRGPVSGFIKKVFTGKAHKTGVLIRKKSTSLLKITLKACFHVNSIYWWAIQMFIWGSAGFTISTALIVWPQNNVLSTPMGTTLVYMVGMTLYQIGFYLGILEAVNNRADGGHGEDATEEEEERARQLDEQNCDIDDCDDNKPATSDWDIRVRKSGEYKDGVPKISSMEMDVPKPKKFLYWGVQTKSLFWWAWFCFFIAGPFYWVPSLLAVPGVFQSNFTVMHPKAWALISGCLMEVGGILFTIGSICGLLNMQRGRIWGPQILNPGWWAAVSFVPGSILFVASSTCTIANIFPYWGAEFLGFLGSAIFLLGSSLMQLNHIFAVRRKYLKKKEMTVQEIV